MSESLNPNQPKETSQSPQSQVEKKLDHMYRITRGVEDLFFKPPDRKPTKKPVLYPPLIENIKDAMLMFDNKDASKDFPARAEAISRFLANRRPTAEEAEQAHAHPETAREIYTNPEVVQDLRLIDFVFDSNIMRWWSVVDEKTFVKFLDLLDGKLPPYFTSDAEVERLWEEKDHPTIKKTFAGTKTITTVKPEGPETTSEPIQMELELTQWLSARNNFIFLSVPDNYTIPDENGGRKPPIDPSFVPSKVPFNTDVDLESVIATLNEKFPSPTY